MDRDEVLRAFAAHIKNKLCPDTEWMRRTMEAVADGECEPRTARHALWRHRCRAARQILWNGPYCLLDGSEFLRKGHMPPRPVQTRLAVAAARHGNILTLFGPSDLGKTTAAIRALAYLALGTSHLDLVAVHGSTLGRMSASELTDLVEACRHADAVLIDDMDKGSKSETRVSAILEIMEMRERDLHCGPTILTANSCGHELSNRIEETTPGYGVPIVCRMRRGIQIDFTHELPTDEAFHRQELKLLQSVLAHKNPNNEDWIECLEDFGKLKVRPFLD